MALFILGLLVGLAIAPVLRSWIVWREHQAASRAAWLADETLRLLEEQYQQDSSADRDSGP